MPSGETKMLLQHPNSMVLSCQELIALLGDYRASSLTVELAVLAELHLAGCLDCSAYARSYEETIRLSKAALASPETETPEDLVHAILASAKRLRLAPPR